MNPPNDPNLRTSEPQNLTPSDQSRLRRFLKEAALCSFVTFGCFFFVLFGLRMTPPARAQGTPTCTPTPTPTATPAPCTTHANSPCPTPPCTAPTYPPELPAATAIPSPFQPHDAQGNQLSTVLEWRVFEPTPVPSNDKGPDVVLIHEGHFATGNIFSGLLADPIADLQAAGYYVFVVAHRLAPCGLIKGQDCHADSSSGRPPQQTDDIKAFIRAARVDSRCDNHRLAVVGGSSGASHAAFAAFDITSSGSVWPNWNQSGDDRPLAFACLSGMYDFTDRTTDSDYPAVPGDPINDFRNKIENYTGTCVLFDSNGGPNEWSSSPVAHLPPNFTSAKPFRPMYFIHSRHDTIPYHQLFDVQCKLAAAGVTASQYQVLTIPDSSEHAFQYWRSWDGQPGGPTVLVAGDVISFLDLYLK